MASAQSLESQEIAQECITKNTKNVLEFHPAKMGR
jgi:hypothetical protein